MGVGFPWEKASCILRHSICREMVDLHGETRSELAPSVPWPLPLCAGHPRTGCCTRLPRKPPAEGRKCVPALSVFDEVGKTHRGASDAEMCVCECSVKREVL